MEYMEPYEKYKLEWMIDHGITLKDLFDMVDNWAWEVVGGAEDYVSFQCYLEEYGFNGMIWACYSEWLENEGVENDEEN